MKSNNRFVSTMVVSLDGFDTPSATQPKGEWLLATDPQNIGREQQWYAGPVPEAKSTKVPWIIQDAFPGYHGIAWYWRDFEAPVNPHKQGRYLLRFWAVDYKADIWVNGVYVGEHEGSEDMFVLDVTDTVKPKESNRLAVRVLNPTDEPIDGFVLRETPHRVKEGITNIGGILDSVELLVVPAVRVEDLFVRPDPKTGNISIQANVRNALKKPAKAHLVFTVAPAMSGETLDVAEVEQELNPGDTIIETNLQVKNPQLWDLNNPYLYRVTTRVREAESNSFDEQSTRCGFRDFRFEDGYFRLNGRRIFLRCSHTGNDCPIGLHVPHDPDLIRRDLLNVKVMGFNAIRFISGVAIPYQLDLCDEIGLMVYEESYAGWYLQDSPQMAERFNHSTLCMIKRDRNHPSIVIWGLLNENFGGEVLRHAVNSLALVRSLDETRMVTLNSGRNDNQLDIGSLSNPESTVWENVLEDRHPYRRAPHTAEIVHFYRTVGNPPMPYFLSEYGVGSAVDLMRVVRLYEQNNATHVEDYLYYRDKRDQFMADWERWNMAEAFGRPEEFFAQSLKNMAGHRLLGINAIRANPNIVGYSLTGTVDQGLSGEGLTTTFRELKLGTIDAIFDGFAPLRWCLFVEPVNVYRKTSVRLEAVLAIEDALQPGEYPVRLQVVGPNCARVFERTITITISDSKNKPEPAFALPVFSEEVVIDGPSGKYRFLATFERGAAAAGGDAEFYVADAAEMPPVETEVVLWGEDAELAKWLAEHGIRTRAFELNASDSRELILVSHKPASPGGREAFKELARRIGLGSTAIFLSPEVFNKSADWYQHPDKPLGWLPMKNKGAVVTLLNNGIYHPEQWTKNHPIFDGFDTWFRYAFVGFDTSLRSYSTQASTDATQPKCLPCGGLMDYTVYRDIIPDRVWSGQDAPAEAVAGAISAAFGDYASGLLVAVYNLGAGRFILNTLRIRENLGSDPVAERLLRNMLHYASSDVSKPPVDLPDDFDAQLEAMGL